MGVVHGHALRLQGFHERHAVAETFADAFLHEFVHHRFGQFITVRVKALENQRAFDELLQAVIERVVKFLLENVRLRGVLAPQRIGGGPGIIFHFRKGDDSRTHHALDAVHHRCLRVGGNRRAERQP